MLVGLTWAVYRSYGGWGTGGEESVHKLSLTTWCVGVSFYLLLLMSGYGGKDFVRSTGGSQRMTRHVCWRNIAKLQKMTNVISLHDFVCRSVAKGGKTEKAFKALKRAAALTRSGRATHFWRLLRVGLSVLPSIRNPWLQVTENRLPVTVVGVTRRCGRSQRTFRPIRRQKIDPLTLES